jgi:3-methyl-2-oxobutanoate hydroxymethyltransferase
MSEKVTTIKLLQKKAAGERLTMLTAYDYPTGKLVDEAGIDIALVGDSLGNVVLGYENTIPVTMEDMIHHTSAVVRGVERAMVVADMPFMSFQVSSELALISAGRLVKEAGAHAVKLEGGRPVCDTVRRITDAGIPVMGHLGLTPQSVHKFGGYRVQGRTESEAERIVSDARALVEAGVFAIVLELMPAELAREVTAAIPVPSFGIGAGPHCDGQVQVIHDILGLYPGRKPKHAKAYADLYSPMLEALKSYADEVRNGVFPDEEHSF